MKTRCVDFSLCASCSYMLLYFSLVIGICFTNDKIEVDCLFVNCSQQKNTIGNGEGEFATGANCTSLHEGGGV